MKLEDIGFYTLSDRRAKTSFLKSPIWRAELLVTDKCNLNCIYCRGMNIKGDMSLPLAQYVLHQWIENGLKNVRFSGGEPTLYPYLKTLIRGCKKSGVRRIAVSTNGTQPLDCYKELLGLGVNDFSISLDGGCCSMNMKMNGGKNTFYQVIKNIRYLSQYSYVTIGAVFNEINVKKALSIIQFIDGLNVADIRIISSAQYNKALGNIDNLSQGILDKYPILKYRINNYRQGVNVRGITKNDCARCYLVLDDVAVMGIFHYPCIIYLREGGKPIGEINENFRQDRLSWFKNHNAFTDNICRINCLDVCREFNNKVDFYVRKTKRNIF